MNGRAAVDRDSAPGTNGWAEVASAFAALVHANEAAAQELALLEAEGQLDLADMARDIIAQSFDTGISGLRAAAEQQMAIVRVGALRVDRKERKP